MGIITVDIIYIDINVVNKVVFFIYIFFTTSVVESLQFTQTLWIFPMWLLAMYETIVVSELHRISWVLLEQMLENGGEKKWNEMLPVATTVRRLIGG